MKKIITIIIALGLLINISYSYSSGNNRRDDLLLYSKKYQEKIIINTKLNEQFISAFEKWGNELAYWETLPRKDRPTETEIHEKFYSDIFVKAFGYAKHSKSAKKWTIRSEDTTDVDLTRPDGILGYFTTDKPDNDVQVVIELKGLNHDLDRRMNRKQDKRTPIDQGFSYAHKYDNVQWVIASNYKELRIYNKKSSKYSLIFDLKTAYKDTKQLKLLYQLFHIDNLLTKNPKQLSKNSNDYLERETELEQISQKFYSEYKDIRFHTIKDIIKNNDIVPVNAVSYAQKLLDRILFIAFLEDRGLAPNDIIERAYIAENSFNPQPIWDNFQGLFRAVDKGNEKLGIQAYNGGLFAFDKELDTLKISDKTLELYKKLSDYDFESDITETILGNIFEKSITDIETLKKKVADNALDLEDNRRKEEGAFYTPNTVSTYIIEQTLEQKFDDIRKELGFYELPEYDVDMSDASKLEYQEFYQLYLKKILALRIIDLSCGGGAFLVASFDTIMAEINSVIKRLENLNFNRPRLLIDWNKTVLKDMLYGTDISPEALNISKLSLWLKIAHKKGTLVNIDKNFVAGNSVADIDYNKAFPEIMKNGGFDIVLGNPPYVRHELITDYKDKLKSYKTYAGTADLYVYFYELGYDLLKPNGYFGYISSNSWFKAKYGKGLRKFIKENATITHLIDLTGIKIFADAEVETNILVFKKSKPTKNNSFIIKERPFFNTQETMQQEYLDENGYLLENEQIHHLKTKIEKQGKVLKQWDIDVNSGIGTGYIDAFVIDKETRDRLVAKDSNSKDILHPLLKGRHIRQWYTKQSNLYVVGTLPSKNIDINKYPAVKEYLQQFRPRIDQTGAKGSRSKSKHEWFETQATTNYWEDFEKEKIVWSEISPENRFYLDTDKNYIDGSARILVGKNIKYLLAILNSNVINWYHKKTGSRLGSKAYRWINYKVERFPIPEIPEVEQKPFADLAMEIQYLHSVLQSKPNEDLNKKIKDKEKTLNKMIYKIYKLNREEIKLIENKGI